MTSKMRAEHTLVSDTAFLRARANANSLTAAHAALEPFGLRVRSYSVLSLAVTEARLSQRDIAEFLRLDPSQVVVLLDDLQQRALIQRVPDPNDRRTKVVVATAQGRQMYVQAEEAVRAAERETLSPLTSGERHLLRELLHRLAFPS
jgi:DNA-binding MarR family transcriptional regulator